MERIDFLRQSWPLYSTPASRAIEQEALARVAPHTLMQRAGEGVARLALALSPHARTVWIAAGPGNNGGDGLEAGMHLQQWGKAVRVSLLGDPARQPADAAASLARAQAAGVRIESGLAGSAGSEDLLIDALLGLGTSRPAEGAVAQAIGQLNRRAAAVLAVDLPSGLDAVSGQPIGELAVRATHTLALLTLKPGLFTGAGRDHAGEVWLDTLGVTTGRTPDAVLCGGAASLTRPARRHAQHKGSFGDVHVVGGAAGMVGAALLAARAAHAAGAGRVHLALLDPGAPGLDPHCPELMFRPGWWLQPPRVIAASTVLCGCGGGEAVRHALPALLSNATRLVLDADALNALATDAALQSQLAARAARGRPTILTPHPLEAARLLACSAREVQTDRLGSAAALAQRLGCVVLLKGSGSVVCAPGVVARINPTGNAALATAGTGDVLAGWLAGRWAQETDASFAAAHAVAADAAFQHGLAAEGAVPPLRAGMLIERLHALG